MAFRDYNAHLSHNTNANLLAYNVEEYNLAKNERVGFVIFLSPIIGDNELSTAPDSQWAYLQVSHATYRHRGLQNDVERLRQMSGAQSQKQLYIQMQRELSQRLYPR